MWYALAQYWSIFSTFCPLVHNCFMLTGPDGITYYYMLCITKEQNKPHKHVSVSNGPVQGQCDMHWSISSTICYVHRDFTCLTTENIHRHSSQRVFCVACSAQTLLTLLDSISLDDELSDSNSLLITSAVVNLVLCVRLLATIEFCYC